MIQPPPHGSLGGEGRAHLYVIGRDNPAYLPLVVECSWLKSDKLYHPGEFLYGEAVPEFNEGQRRELKLL